MTHRRAFLLSGFALSACATAPASVAPTSPPVVDPASYLGAAPDALDDLLGAPALVRAEGAGAFRRYDGASCSVYVLIGRNEAGEAVISQIDAGARAPGETAPEPGACMAWIAAEA